MLRLPATKTGLIVALVCEVLTVLAIVWAGSIDARAASSMARLQNCLRSCGHRAARCIGQQRNRRGDCDLQEGVCKAECRTSIRN
jgi:hypothetical protein